MVVEESEVGQSPHPCLEAEDVPKIGPTREGNDGEGGAVVQVNPPTSPPSISHSDSGRPDANTGTSVIPNPAQDILRPNTSELNAPNENKSDWKSTASSAAKLFLRGVRDSADAFGPLRSVAGGLYFIPESCERIEANKQAIEWPASKIKALSASLCTPVSEDDIKGGERRRRWSEILRELEKVLQEPEPLAEQGKIEGFFECGLAGWPG